MHDQMVYKYIYYDISIIMNNNVSVNKIKQISVENKKKNEYL